MRRKPDSVPSFLEPKSNRYERLNVTAGPNNLYNDIQLWRRERCSRSSMAILQRQDLVLVIVVFLLGSIDTWENSGHKAKARVDVNVDNAIVYDVDVSHVSFRKVLAFTGCHSPWMPLCKYLVSSSNPVSSGVTDEVLSLLEDACGSTL